MSESQFFYPRKKEVKIILSRTVLRIKWYTLSEISSILQDLDKLSAS